jgi:6-phosphogluconolactonase
MASYSGDQQDGSVYTQTNESVGNRLMVFERGMGGALTPAGSLPTGGAGDGIPHVTSQGSVMLTGDRRHLLVTNAGSGDLSVFAVGDGVPSLLQRAAAGGAPKSVTEHRGLVYVLNTDPPSVNGFRMRGETIEPLDGSERVLPAESDPAQVGLSPDGRSLVITERGANDIACYPVGADGYLGPPMRQASSGPTPYGFAFTKAGALVVTEAFGAQKGKAAASSYVMRDGDLEPASRSISNGHSEICWATVTPDDRYAYTTNFADGAVSRYAIGADGSLTLDDPAAGTAVVGHTGLRDEGLTADGRYLYAIDADSQQVFGWSVGSGGTLSPIGAWGGIPATVGGIAAR